MYVLPHLMMQLFRSLWTGNPSSCCFSCSLADALGDLWKCPALICSLPSIFETKSSLKDFSTDSWFVCPMQDILNMSRVFTALAMFLALSVVLPTTFSATLSSSLSGHHSSFQQCDRLEAHEVSPNWKLEVRLSYLHQLTNTLSFQVVSSPGLQMFQQYQLLLVSSRTCP